ncbi:putative aquaporin-5 [Diaporthe eres]|uniref:Aquaporin-5 n=1 Tax=Diaporthe eres TaxID=83184 RepID=A0ABR1P5C8_DIAER
MANEHSIPIGVAYDDAAHMHGQQSSEDRQNDVMETTEKHVDEDRLEDSLSPNTAVEEQDELSDDSTPPVPPVPRQLSSRASRTRIRRGQPKSYDSDPQTYGQDMPRMMSSRSNRPRFQDEMYESDPHYGSDRAWREEIRHPDYQDRRYVNRGKPPRAFLNNQQSPGTKQWVEESRSYQDPFSPMQPPKRFYTFDEEQGYGPGYPGGYNNRQTFSTDDSPRIQWNALTKEQKAEVLRLPWLQWMNSDFKNHFVASLGEFVGTTMFLFFAFAGTEVANIASDANGSNNSSDSNTTTGGSTGFNVNVLLYIALSFGFSLMVNVWIFFRISGGLFNPAVTLALMLIRAISVFRAIALFISQILGGIMASVLVRFLFPENFNVRTTLGGGANIAQGIFIEALLTAELVFTIYMLAAEKHRATFMAPIGIGLALFIAEMVGVQFTGGSLNPARSFGPCVVTATFDPEHWIYWLGPFLGALIAWLFYRFIKALEYEMVNPGADGDPLNDPTKNPEKAAEIKIARQKTSLSSMKTP